MRLLVSILIWIVGALITMATFLASVLLSVILYPFPFRKKIVHAQCFWWSDAIIALNPYWKISIKGLQNIDPSKTYVIVANHQSLADIVIIYQIRTYFKWVAKEELLKVPFIGGLLWINNHIMLSRGDFSSVKEVYKKAAEYLKSGISMLFFPEGTRSSTDQMGEFQNGAFKLAIREGKSVLPIFIGGTREAIPKGGFIFKTKVSGKLVVLPPIDTSSFKIADYAVLRDMVREQLQKVASEKA
ncbi:MAG: lysophospholipid acyltransferase family protein [Candidatus Omnitrophica bacterium]|nr:lysophospholipid acyltransferase family protein [Candidatus Omnitrophota bacterium]